MDEEEFKFRIGELIHAGADTGLDSEYQSNTMHLEINKVNSVQRTSTCYIFDVDARTVNNIST